MTQLPEGTVVVPLTSGARPIGVVTATRPTATRLSGEQRSLLHSLGSQAGQVIERTQLYEARDWMLGMVAHDLRTPLGTIGGLARTLQRIGEAGLPTTAEALLSRIVQTSARLTRLTDNLVSNALKYSPEGARVTVTAHASPSRVHIAVVDRGPGIEPHEVTQLFTPFQRTSNEATAGERSTGLGLAIAHHLVTAHGGDISVDSAAGVGTTFTVSLPRLGPDAGS